jgi:chromosome segregation ATPase
MLKPVIVILLVLSLVSLVLGIMLFGKREILKGRILNLEDGAKQVAANIHYDDFDAAALKDYQKMKAPLGKLSVFAENQYDELVATKQDLDNTKTELAQTQEKLSATEQERDRIQAKADELENEIEAKEVELAQKENELDQLKDDKANLQSQIDDLDTKLVQAEEETRDLQDQIVTLENAIAKLESELEPDRVGNIPEGLAPNAEMLVHRDDRLIGKVKISTVEENMAVAEIVNSWEQVPVREGDYVLF